MRTTTIRKPSKNNEIMLNLIRNVELAVSQLSECGITVLNADILSYSRPTIWVNGNEFCRQFEVTNAYYWRNNSLYCTVNSLFFNCRIVWADIRPGHIH